MQRTKLTGKATLTENGDYNQENHFVIDVDFHHSLDCLLTDQQSAHTHTHTHTHARTHTRMHERTNKRSTHTHTHTHYAQLKKKKNVCALATS